MPTLPATEALDVKARVPVVAVGLACLALPGTACPAGDRDRFGGAVWKGARFKSRGEIAIPVGAKARVYAFDGFVHGEVVRPKTETEHGSRYEC